MRRGSGEELHCQGAARDCGKAYGTARGWERACSGGARFAVAGALDGGGDGICDAVFEVEITDFSAGVVGYGFGAFVGVRDGEVERHRVGDEGVARLDPGGGVGFETHDFRADGWGVVIEFDVEAKELRGEAVGGDAAGPFVQGGIWRFHVFFSRQKGWCGKRRKG